jgi:large subunit ribosomal protein L9
MKVILLEELKGTGGEGDVVEVATGYAVNFLFPQKIAIAATSGNLKQLEQRKHNIAKRETNRLDTADKLVAALEGQTIRIGAKVGEEGQLFGSVTTIQVAAAINAQFNTDIDRKRIDLHGLIKTVGEHLATISIYRDIKATITIEVVDERVLKAAEVAEVAEAEAVEVEAVEAEAEAAEVAEVESEAADAAESVAEAEVADETAQDARLEEIEDALSDAAQTLAQAADAAEGEDAAVADAAVEVLQDIEAALDAALVEDAETVEDDESAETAESVESDEDAEAAENDEG